MKHFPKSLDLNSMYYFVQVVDFGNFTAASKSLGVPKSTLSRAISELEETLGVRLIHRSTRQFAVTDIGREYYQECLNMVEAVDVAQSVIDKNHVDPQGLIKMSCPTALLNFVLAGVVARFMSKYPKVEIQLESTNRQVDIAREGIDIALRVGATDYQDSSLVVKTLSASPQVLVCHPRLLAQYGDILMPAELTQYPSLHAGLPQRNYRWQLQKQEGEEVSVEYTPRLVTDDLVTIRRAVLEGLGIAQLPLLVTFKDLHLGSLVQVLNQWSPIGAKVHAVFNSRKGMAPSLRLFLDYVSQELGEMDFSNLEAMYHGYQLKGDEDACILTGYSQ